jgi:hypothetical protein
MGTRREISPSPESSGSSLKALEEVAMHERFETGACKSTEEIEKLAMREDLGEFDRVLLLLQSANPLQRLCGISAAVPLVPSLPQPPPTTTTSPMTPKSPAASRGRASLSSASASASVESPVEAIVLRLVAAATPGPRTTRDHQMAVADAFAQLLAARYVPPQMARDVVLPLTTRAIKAAGDN